jgi:hypothetical protein
MAARNGGDQSAAQGEKVKIWWPSLLLAVLTGTAVGQQNTCDGPAYHELDFWLGTWQVVSPAGEPQGENRIEKVLNGCAVLEHWRDASGREGKSLFYYQLIPGMWKQVWVTDEGQVKEKSLMRAYRGPGVRFQGRLPRKQGGTYLDRTTLTPLLDGRVQQVIEVSFDGGLRWDPKRRWEGIYRRVQ